VIRRSTVLGLAAILTLGLTTSAAGTTRVPRPTVTPIASELPDLVVDSAYIAVPGYHGGCLSSGTVNLSLHVCIKSTGAASGPFDISVNGESFARVAGIERDATVCALGRYTRLGNMTIVLDSANEVEESNEGNNEETRSVPIPSRPPICTRLPTPTPTPPARPCPGDCNDNGKVTVNELITGINIGLDRASVSSCPYYADVGCPLLRACVNDLMDAVNAALHGCP
jgi:hypothetical protein